jgi:hypothetical protein
LHIEFAIDRNETEGLVWCCLLAPCFQCQGRGQHRAEPDIGEVRSFGQIDAQQHMTPRRGYPGRSAAVHPRHQASGAKAERLQDGKKQQIVLIAIAAAATTHELLV